jgi:hypothetical protein
VLRLPRLGSIRCRSRQRAVRGLLPLSEGFADKAPTRRTSSSSIMRVPPKSPLSLRGGHGTVSVCDEAHRLANEGLSWRLVEKTPCHKRWFLTATPIVNKKGNLQAFFALLAAPYSDATASQYIMARTMVAVRRRDAAPSEACD